MHTTVLVFCIFLILCVSQTKYLQKFACNRQTAPQNRTLPIPQRHTQPQEQEKVEAEQNLWQHAPTCTRTLLGLCVIYSLTYNEFPTANLMLETLHFVALATFFVTVATHLRFSTPASMCACMAERLDYG